MRIIIVGAGEVGTEIARQMADEKKDVILIEKNPEKVKLASSALDVTVLEGEGTDPDLLREAGVASADIFIAATTSDEVNLIACFLVAAEHTVPVKIARVRNVQYSQSRAFNSRLSGVDYLVNPDQEAAIEIFQTIEQGAESTVMIFDNLDIQLREYYIDAESILKDKTLKDIKTELKENFLITGVLRKGELTIPDGNYMLQEDDHVYIVSLKRVFRKLSRKLGGKSDKLRKILIVGGSAIGISVAEMLISRGRSVTILDKDYDHCKELAEILPEALVLNGDISDHQLFRDEDMAGVDAIVSCTGNEELDILAGVYGKAIGIKRAIALVEKTSYLTIAGEIGINSIVSPKFCAINSILKYVRKGNIQSIHSVFDGGAEAIEITVTPTSPLVNKALKDMDLPKGCLIAAVNRGRKSIIPDGNFVLQPDDSVVFFALRSKITELEGILG